MISVGIDVSKGKSTVCILKPYGEVLLSPRELLHTETGVTELLNLISSFGEETKVIMEATGAYHMPLLCRFLEHGLFVCVINPFLMKKYASVSMRKGKTDNLDATKIAGYGIDNWFHLKAFQPQEEVYQELKLLVRQYDFYIRMRVAAVNNLTAILDKTVPGLKAILPHTNANKTKSKLCDFTTEFWHFDIITAMSEARFVNACARWAKKKGYRLDERRAKSIYALAQNSIPSLPSHAPSVKMLVLESIRVLQKLDKTLVPILTQMRALASSLPEYDTVFAMNGVGETIAPRLIAEIGDVRRFHSGSALVAFAGVDAPPFQSGAFVSNDRRISKRGSAHLRKTGFEIMRMLKARKPTEDNAVYQFILKKEAEGKPKNVAKMAGLNKFLRIYYARVMDVYR